MDKNNKKLEQIVETRNITFEEIQKKLIELSRNGNRSKIRVLIVNSGKVKLLDIPKGKYLEIMREVETW